MGRANSIPLIDVMKRGSYNVSKIYTHDRQTAPLTLYMTKAWRCPKARNPMDECFCSLIKPHAVYHKPETGYISMSSYELIQKTKHAVQHNHVFWVQWCIYPFIRIASIDKASQATTQTSSRMRFTGGTSANWQRGNSDTEKSRLPPTQTPQPAESRVVFLGDILH